MIGFTSVGIPKNAGASLALYTPKEQDEYLHELAESLKKGAQPYVIEERDIESVIGS